MSATPKMKSRHKSFRQSMSQLHTWAGLALAGLMYFIFVTGTAGYFHYELDRWLQPERPLAAKRLTDDVFLFPADNREPVTRSTSQLIDLASERLALSAGTDVVWWGLLLPDVRHGNLWIEWQPPRRADGTRPERKAEYLSFDSNGAPQWIRPRATGGGEALYRLHWRLHYLPEKIAYWIIGIASMAILVGLITGVVVHRKLFTEFFTFRLFHQARTWLDLHNLSSVLALPFFIMITYSGLLFFMLIYLQPLVEWRYTDSSQAVKEFQQRALPKPPPRRKLFQPEEQLPLSNLFASYRSLSPMPITQLYVLHPGDKHAQVSLYIPPQSPVPRTTEPDRIMIDGTNGERLEPEAHHHTALASVYETLINLHEGLFASIGTRLLYGLSGLLGCIMIASGVIFWLRKPRPSRPYPQRVAKFYGVILLGLPVAVAGYFWANRLLPLDLPERQEWELHVLFILWAAMVPLTYFSVRRVWMLLSLLAGLSWALLPLLNALTTEHHLARSLWHQDWVLLGIDTTMLLTGLCFLIGAAALRQSKR